MSHHGTERNIAEHSRIQSFNSEHLRAQQHQEQWPEVESEAPAAEDVQVHGFVYAWLIYNVVVDLMRLLVACKIQAYDSFE